MNTTYTNDGNRVRQDKLSKDREIHLRRVAELVAEDVRKLFQQEEKRRGTVSSSKK